MLTNMEISLFESFVLRFPLTAWVELIGFLQLAYFNQVAWLSLPSCLSGATRFAPDCQNSCFENYE